MRQDFFLRQLSKDDRTEHQHTAQNLAAAQLCPRISHPAITGRYRIRD